MIYAIRAVGTQYIKFGFTDYGIKKRLETLQIGCPLDLEVLATCYGKRNVETWIHWMLHKAGAHHRGEWFKECKDTAAVIELMKADSWLKTDPAKVTAPVEVRRHRLGRALALGRESMGWANG